MKNRNLLIGIIILLIVTVICLALSLHRVQKKLFSEKSALAKEKSLCAKEMFDFVVEKPDVALRLYQLMKDVDMVLQKHAIEYWASDGTLIRAVRHKGIIPYDDDLDIQIDSQNSEKLELALLDLGKLGYKISESRKDWVQVHSYDKCSGIENHLDIFAMDFDSKDNAYLTDPRALEIWGKRRMLKKSEIFPLKQYKFGEIYISGPQNPLPYLKGFYSEDILTTGCIYGKHSNSILNEIRCLVLEGQMLEPLKPTGPLIDNSKIYQN